eukprot:7380827-Prymnesium_polylepis.2
MRRVAPWCSPSRRRAAARSPSAAPATACTARTFLARARASRRRAPARLCQAKYAGRGERCARVCDGPLGAWCGSPRVDSRANSAAHAPASSDHGGRVPPHWWSVSSLQGRLPAPAAADAQRSFVVSPVMMSMQWYVSKPVSGTANSPTTTPTATNTCARHSASGGSEGGAWQSARCERAHASREVSALALLKTNPMSTETVSPCTEKRKVEKAP